VILTVTGDAPSSSSASTTTTVEIVKSIVTTFQPILRRDLPDDIKTVVHDKITNATQQQSVEKLQTSTHFGWIFKINYL
jgi:hypothetical protein